jgi:outer membrane protein assembly factor BamB
MIIIYGVQYEPEPSVLMFKDVIINSSTPWLTYRFDVTHRGMAPIDCEVKNGLLLEWKTKRLNIGEYGASKSSPAVDDSKIYLGLDTGELIAVDRLSGSIIWSFYTRNSRNGIHGSPTINPDFSLVYIGAYDGWIYAVDINSGDYVWENKLGDFIGSSPVLYNGVVFIGVEMREPAGYLVGVDAKNGLEVFRSNKLGSHPHSTPTIDPESESILIGANDGCLYCYSISNYSEKWVFKTQGDIKSTASVYDGIAYITSWDGYLYAINVYSGKQIWSYKSNSASMSSPTLDIWNKIVYFGNHYGMFYAINMNTGKMIWRYSTDGKIMSSPTLVNSTHIIIIGSNDGCVYLLDSLKGTLKEKKLLNSGFSGVPVTVGDHLYIFDHLGYLYSFKTLKP